MLAHPKGTTTWLFPAATTASPPWCTPSALRRCCVLPVDSDGWSTGPLGRILFHMSYGPFVPAYAAMATLYSGGAIPACHRWAVERMPPGARVLFAGAGPGTDVVQAARAGLRVTAVDVCPVMLAAARRRVQRAGVTANVKLLEADVRHLPVAHEYDVVCAQFFLNVFAAHALPRVLAALAGQLAAGGRLLVGDFRALPPGGRVWQRLWHDVPMHVFARTGANVIHPVHDLPAHLQAAGFRLHKRQCFRLFCGGPAWVEGLETSCV